jgi:hypothetical protein
MRSLTTLLFSLGFVALLACSSDNDPNPGNGAAGGTTAVAGPGGSGGSGGAGGQPPSSWLGSEVRFAVAAEASAFLGTSDGFTQAMSAFDRGMRMKTIDPVTETGRPRPRRRTGARLERS